jgi:hypothetical protein
MPVVVAVLAFASWHEAVPADWFAVAWPTFLEPGLFLREQQPLRSIRSSERESHVRGNIVIRYRTAACGCRNLASRRSWGRRGRLLAGAVLG